MTYEYELFDGSDYDLFNDSDSWIYEDESTNVFDLLTDDTHEPCLYSSRLIANVNSKTNTAYIKRIVYFNGEYDTDSIVEDDIPIYGKRFGLGHNGKLIEHEPQLIKCPICGRYFVDWYRTRKYCSDECSDEARLMMYRSRTDRHTECMEMFNESYAKMIYQALKRAGGKSELSGVESDDLIVHHLNGYHWDLAGRCDLANVIVLTREEHEHFHSIYGNKFNTVEQFNEFINMY